jgi:hypothetical protein
METSDSDPQALILIIHIPSASPSASGRDDEETRQAANGPADSKKTGVMFDYFDFDLSPAS